MRRIERIRDLARLKEITAANIKLNEKSMRDSVRYLKIDKLIDAELKIAVAEL